MQHQHAAPNSFRYLSSASLKFDHILDRLEVLRCVTLGASSQCSGSAHLDLDVEVLQIKRVLPNVHSNDWYMRQQLVLVRRRHDLERLALGVVALLVPSTQLAHEGETKRNETTYKPSPPHS